MFVQELTEEGLPFLILFHQPDDVATVNTYRNEVAKQLLSEKSKSVSLAVLCVCVCVCVCVCARVRMHAHILTGVCSHACMCDSVILFISLFVSLHNLNPHL